MKQLKFKIFGISYDTGRPISIKVDIICNEDFKTTRIPNELIKLCPNLKGMLDEEIVETDFSKYDSWYEGEDKTELMYIHNLSQINTWEILQIDGKKPEQKKKPEIIESKLAIRVNEELVKIRKVDKKRNDVLFMIEYNITNSKMVDDMLACYINLYDTIKDLNYKKQFSIILDSVSIAYKSSMNTLEELSDYSKSLKGKSLKELKQLKK